MKLVTALLALAVPGPVDGATPVDATASHLTITVPGYSDQVCRDWIADALAADVDGSGGLSADEFHAFLAGIDNPSYVAAHSSSDLTLPWWFKVAHSHEALACWCKVLGLGDGCCEGAGAEISFAGLLEDTRQPLEVQQIEREYRADLCNSVAAISKAVVPKKPCELCLADGLPINADLKTPGVAGTPCDMAAAFASSLAEGAEDCVNLQIARPVCCGNGGQEPTTKSGDSGQEPTTKSGKKSGKSGKESATKSSKGKRTKASTKTKKGKGTKTIKKSPKGKGSKDTKAPTSEVTKVPTKSLTTQTPISSPTLDPTQSPTSTSISVTQSPTSSPTLDPTQSPTTQIPTPSPTRDNSVVFAIDVCSPGCSEFSDLIDAGAFQHKIRDYALGVNATDDAELKIQTDTSKCDPCEIVLGSRRNRFLQDTQSNTKKTLIFEIKFKETDTPPDSNFESAIVAKLNENIENINEELAEAGVEVRIDDELIEVTTKQPTQNPTQTPTTTPLPSSQPSPLPEVPSPPPTDLTMRRIAEQMNQFYNVSRNVVQSQQDRKDLREKMEKVFDNAHDLEDIFTNSYVEPVKAHDRSSRRRVTEVESEDYYDELPDVVTQEADDPLKCKCVDCDEDETCGGLWKGKRYQGDYDLKAKKIHIVVSHCMHDLDWITDFTKGYDTSSIHVISKCGKPVKGAPEAATIEVLPNVGRCDHTYAYYITTVLGQKLQTDGEEESIVVFLKNLAVGVLSSHCSDLHLLKTDSHVVVSLETLTLVQIISFSPHTTRQRHCLSSQQEHPLVT